MFDRARCLDPPPLIASPFVSMDALSVLSDLLRQALKPPMSSSNAPHSGASRSSHDQNRGEAHDHAKPGTTASDAGRTGLQQSDRSQQIDLFDGVTPTQTPAWRDPPEKMGVLMAVVKVQVSVHRLWRAAGLQVPRKRPKAGCGHSAATASVRSEPGMVLRLRVRSLRQRPAAQVSDRHGRVIEGAAVVDRRAGHRHGIDRTGQALAKWRHRELQRPRIDDRCSRPST
jgi:hypothetical protein